MRSVQHNIRYLSIIQVLRYCMVMMPIITLFFTTVGLTMYDIMVTQAVFSAVIFIFEIPSGYFSDVLGRRTTMIIGVLLGVAGFGVYCVATGFWSILLAECVLGIGASFISGTDSALMFDSLAELGQTERSIEQEGKQISFGNFSEAVAGIVGGLLAIISIRTPLYVQTGVLALAIPFAFLLVEPKRHTYSNELGTFKGIWEISKWAVLSHLRLRWLILYSGILGAATLTMVWFIQPYMVRCGLPVGYFGFAWAALNLSVGFFSFNAHTLERKFGERVVVAGLLIVVVLGYILTSMHEALWMIPVLLCFYFVRGMNNPIFTTYINQMVPSDRRATVLSARQLVTRTIFIVTGPISGWVSDHYSMSTALLSCGLVFLLTGGIMLIYVERDLAPEAEVV
ncbi:MAG: MFS transporter [Candidatus Kapaibacterium sp.]